MVSQLALDGRGVEPLAAVHEVKEERDEILVGDAAVDERRPVAGAENFVSKILKIIQNNSP